MAVSLTPAPARVSKGPGRTGNKMVLILMPAVALVAVFFVYPLVNILWLSVTEPEPGIGNYTKLFGDGISVTILFRTLITAASVGLVTLLIAYPYAYAMTKVSARTRGVMTILVLLPFWTSVMARNFAWYLLEQRGGVIEQAFAAIGIKDVVLLGSLAGVTIAMVQVMLPYMVLPLFTSLSSIDHRLMDAAISCGAPWRTAFRTIYLPLSVPGMVSGFSLVFIMALGFYITPAILGSPQQSLVSQLIATRVSDVLDFGGAGALSVLLLTLTLAVLALVSRITIRTAERNS